MKKLIALILALCMVFALAACGQQAKPEESAAPETNETETNGTETNETETETNETEATEAAYKLGMGIVVSLDSSDTNKAQVDATVATVVTDAEGKIVACRLDVAQSKMDVTDGAVEPEKSFLSKLELGDDYNMVKFSDATLEWYEQAANFEEYAVGKTAAEIAGAETVLNDEGHTVFVDETLYASVSISIKDFQEAVVKACNDDQGQTFTSDGSFKLGLAVNTTAEESEAATAEQDGVVKMYSEFGAAVVDEDGKIIVALTDAIQPKISINTDGEITDKAFKATKRELKEDYNMVAYSDATLEWYEQAKNYVDYAAGKTADELLNAETVVNDEGHTVFADETLYASVSISIDGMAAVLAKAVNNAR